MFHINRMTRTALEVALQKNKPFTLHLADGSSHPVPHRDHLSLAPSGIGELVLWEDDGAFHIISLLTITKLSFDKPARAGKAGTASR